LKLEVVSPNPFTSGGIVLDEITAFNAKYVMSIVTNNDGGQARFFATIDEIPVYNFCAERTGTFAILLLSCSGLALISRRKR
jgi:hypothetical protein